MKKNPSEWIPVGIDALETAAFHAVRSDNNLLVLAGPGAGKTELLAQKACFLLQTQICKSPKRILAISFKKDSAVNLKQRVIERCGDDALRFDSLTFDGFAKSILDRFREALPQEFKPSRNYDIGLTTAQISTFLDNLDYSRRPEPQHLASIVNTSHQWTKQSMVKKFESDYFTGFQLNETNRNHEYILNWAADELWKTLLLGNEGRSRLTFQMISRLSDLIIRSNQFIKKSIQATYSHVFLDEFQDTTNIQYDLLKSCFLNSNSKLISVGDGKQRIMLWAGALHNIFERYENDFQAEKVDLLMNFRCAPKLVELQTIIAQSLDSSAVSQISSKDIEGILKRIDFANEFQEADKIAEKVKSLIEQDGISPQSICFLFKQRVDINSQNIILKIQEAGLKIRVEDTYQDLLKEDFIQVIVFFIKYILEIDTSARDKVLNTLINTDQPLSEIRKMESKLKDFKKIMKGKSLSLTTIIEFKDYIELIIKFIGDERIISLMPHYNLEYVGMIKNRFIELFFGIFSRELSLSLAINEFLGVDVVKCMSIHKSKGLEFEVVFLIGLEDRIFWNFRQEPIEDTNTFFVAVSRPISQLYITFCNNRGGVSQTRNNISVLYSYLDTANTVHKVFT